MTGLVRKAILLSAVGLVVAGAAFAGVPNAANSTKPGFINTTGYTNPPDPAGAVMYVIRDLGGFLVANAEVVLDFTPCTDINLSMNISGANTVTTCGSKRVTGNTDGLGVLQVNVVAGGNALGATRAVYDCVLVTVNSVPFPSINASTLDRDGAGGVVSGDLSLMIYDAVNNPAAGRSDYNDDGIVNSNDLAILIGIAVAGASAQSGAPFCP